MESRKKYGCRVMTELSGDTSMIERVRAALAVYPLQSFILSFTRYQAAGETVTAYVVQGLAYRT